MNNNAQRTKTTTLCTEDRDIAITKSEQLRDLLPLLFKEYGLTSSPVAALAIELIEDVTHALHRLD